MSNSETITITKSKYNSLLFARKQIKEINKIAVELENGEIDGFDFGECVLNII